MAAKTNTLPHKPLSVGVVNPSDVMLETCEEALQEIGTITALEVDGVTGKLPPGPGFDVLVVPLLPPVAAAVAFFERCRRANPVEPMILLASGFDVDTAVELLAYGADDLASVPVEPTALCRKVLRAFGRYRGPAYDTPELSPLRPPTPPPGIEERRRCFRAKIPAWHPMGARLILRHRAEFFISVVDLSIPTEGWPGGMLLRVAPLIARELPLSRWQAEERLKILVDLPDRGKPIDLECRFVTGVRLAERRCVDFAVQYKTRSAAESGRLRRYWADVQRQMVQR